MQYKIGNLFDHEFAFNERVMIPHIVNNIGKWGSGFVIPLGKTFFPYPYQSFRPADQRPFLFLRRHTRLVSFRGMTSQSRRQT